MRATFIVLLVFLGPLACKGGDEKKENGEGLTAKNDAEAVVERKDGETESPTSKDTSGDDVLEKALLTLGDEAGEDDDDLTEKPKQHGDRFIEKLMARFDDDEDGKLSVKELDDLVMIVKMFFFGGKWFGPHHGGGMHPGWPGPGGPHPHPHPGPHPEPPSVPFPEDWEGPVGIDPWESEGDWDVGIEEPMEDTDMGGSGEDGEVDAGEEPLTDDDTDN